METVSAQSISEQKDLKLVWGQFKEWSRESLLVHPVLFMLGAIVLVFITRAIDLNLMANANLSNWWLAKPGVGVPIATQIASSALSFLAIVFSISLVALQLANQQYSPRVISIFERSGTTKITLSLFIGTFVYSILLMIELLRSKAEEVTTISIITNLVLVFACIVAFIFFMRSVMLMIRVTYIITAIADSTREAIENNIPFKEDCVDCPAVFLEKPLQVIRYTRQSNNNIFVKRYEHGVFRALEHSELVQIAAQYNCVLRVLPRFGDYINDGDPIVEVYGERELNPHKVLKAIYVEPERAIYQDPPYGVRMLVDMALQALSPAVNAPTTAYQAILRLTNILDMIGQRPEHSGVFADEDNLVRLLYPVYNWEEYVDLTFSEIILYGKDDLQTRRSLATSFDYLLNKVPAAYRPALEAMKASIPSS